MKTRLIRFRAASSLALVALFLGVTAAVRAQEITDAVARELTVYNDLRVALAVPPSDAVAREVTAFNDLRASLAVPTTDAVAREVTAFNDLRTLLAVPAADAVAREVTAFNDLRVVLSVPSIDAVAREFTVGLVSDTFGDVRALLAIVGGITGATSADMTKFDLVLGTSAGQLDVRDAARLVRKLTGLDP